MTRWVGADRDCCYVYMVKVSQSLTRQQSEMDGCNSHYRYSKEKISYVAQSLEYEGRGKGAPFVRVTPRCGNFQGDYEHASETREGRSPRLLCTATSQRLCTEAVRVPVLGPAHSGAQSHRLCLDWPTSVLRFHDLLNRSAKELFSWSPRRSRDVLCAQSLPQIQHVVLLSNKNGFSCYVTGSAPKVSLVPSRCHFSPG